MDSHISVYKARYVVPVSSPPIVNGAVAVEGDRIIDVGFSDEIVRKHTTADVYSFENAAILPGLVNCHSHLELTAFRGSVDRFDRDFGSWLYEITKLRRDRDGIDDIGLSALLGAAEFAAAGITAAGDIGRVGSAGLEALEQIGLRGTVFQETEFSPSDSTAKVDFDALCSKFEGLAERFDGLVKPGISPHAPFTVSRKLFEKITRYAISNDVRLSIHAAESAAESELMMHGTGRLFELLQKESVDWQVPHQSTIGYFHEIGVLEAAPLLAHCIRVTEREIGLIARSGSSVAHCPKSNAKFGHGIAPLREFVTQGVTTGIGTDSMASNNSCDLFEESRFAGLLSRTAGSESVFLEAKNLVELITIGGAKALGISGVAGSLETGKQADITVISIDGLGQSPVYDIYSTIAFSTSASAVVRTIVAGKTIYADGQLSNADIEDIKRRAGKRFGIGQSV